MLLLVRAELNMSLGVSETEMHVRNWVKVQICAKSRTLQAILSAVDHKVITVLQ